MGGLLIAEAVEEEMAPLRTVSHAGVCPHLCPQEHDLVGTFAISDASGDLSEMSHDPPQEAGS